MRCSTCGGVMIRDLDGPTCFNCGRPSEVRVPVNVWNARRCEGCGHAFVPRRPHGRFCTENCRVRVWTRKKRAA